MAQFHVDLAQRGTPLRHSWSHTVGSGHAGLALRADWQAQLRRCREEIGVRHVRFHGILSNTGALTVQQGETIYSFYNAFHIYDFLVGIGMRPVVELGLMPDALASGGRIVFSYAANVSPPKDMDAWAELIRRFVGGLVDRYGAEEVRRWYFEVWNEPNIKHFWSGTQDDYFALYRATAEAVKGVDDGLRVGGPATANNGWVEEAVAFCEEHGLPLDFVTTHHYPTDAFGDPGDDTEAQLAAAHRNVLRERTQDTVAKAGGRPVLYTEWNTSSNPFFWRHDSPYAAAFVMKTLLDVADLVEAYSYWTFSDIFEENYFSSVPFHGGFGLLTIHGVAKPTYRAFELLNRLGSERLLVDGLHPTLDCYAVRNEDERSLTLLLTNHALPEHDIADERVEIRLAGAPAVARATVERIDQDHANPRRTWEAMGEPTYPSPAQLDALHAASRLAPEPISVEADGDGAALTLDVPAHAVAAVTLTFDA